MIEMSGNRPIGEIVEVSTVAFTAQCLEDPRPTTPCLFDPPDFGSFVRIAAPGSHTTPPASAEEEDPFAAPSVGATEYILSPNTTFALVCHARMASLDPTRRPLAMGYPDESSLLASQPQLAELITTEFAGLLVAHTDSDGRLRRYLPPRPPRIHSRVTPCGNQEVRAITADLSFLRSVLGQSGAGLPAIPQDELAAAAIRTAWNAHNRGQAYLLAAGKKLLEFLADDYERLQAIMASVL